MPVTRTVALVTLGCVRNEVDSEEIAGRLAAAGWRLVDDAADADVAVVNTCAFVAQAKKDSIDTLLEAADLRENTRSRTKAVVAVGCLAERYGIELARSLSEVDAVLGFDSYAELAGHLEAVLNGERPDSHEPRDRRLAWDVSGTEPSAPRTGGAVEIPLRRRLDDRPWAPVKIASGCDRRCAFCAIPSFRGAFVSRTPQEILAEGRWLADQGARELLLVSENSTSYGKDLADPRLLESVLPRLVELPGVARVRISYLQPAELRPGLLETIATTAGVAPYFDLSFQHASAPLLRRMRRFGGTEEFLELLDRIRTLAPEAGIRSNVIVGFPGETEDDLDELVDFLTRARLDVIGVFGYSDEEGTEAAMMSDKVSAEVITQRVATVTGLVEELMAQRAQERVGEHVEVLIEEVPDGADAFWTEPSDPGDDVARSGEEGRVVVGRAGHQGPEVDGVTGVLPADPSRGWDDQGGPPSIGDLVPAVVVDSDGPDLVARIRSRG
jgi:ribosomal protein S12 methylthiotransferase RimO